MGSVPQAVGGSPDAPLVASSEELSVLVTGFGPFLDAYPINSSWEIARHLPPFLPATAAHPTRVRIHVHPQPVRVAYKDVLETVRALHEATYDVVLHIGLAAGRTYYTLERLAYRDRFDKLKDVDGRRFPASEAERAWHGAPTVLRPTLHCDDVWRRWRSVLPDPKIDVRPSDDPGNFLCGFIYYSSLAHLYAKGGERQVMFLHVPDLPTKAEVKRGVEITVALIRALVDCVQLKKSGKVAQRAVLEGAVDEQVPLAEYPEQWALKEESASVDPESAASEICTGRSFVA